VAIFQKLLVTMKILADLPTFSPSWFPLSHEQLMLKAAVPFLTDCTVENDDL
jgi:hypothetical protein